MMNSDHRISADQQKQFANDAIVSLTMRELRSTFSNGRFWVGFLAVVSILVVTGPFETSRQFNFAERIVYWMLICLVTFPIGTGVSFALGVKLHRISGFEWASRIAAGAFAGIPVAVAVWLINDVIFNADMTNWPTFLVICGYSTVISTAIAILYHVISLEVRNSDQAEDASDKSIDNGNEAFLARLPVTLGHDLIRVSAQDHYLEVVTTRGRDMILMRFSDALKELKNTAGIQIHRSHWVAAKHIRKTRRVNSQLHLFLSNDQCLPVSRTFSKSVREYLRQLPVHAA